jgi:hypothetical protein
MREINSRKIINWLAMKASKRLEMEKRTRAAARDGEINYLKALGTLEVMFKTRSGKVLSSFPGS